MREPWVSVYSPDGVERAWRMIAMLGWLPVLLYLLYSADHRRVTTLIFAVGIAAWLGWRFWRLGTQAVHAHPGYLEIRNVSRTHRVPWRSVLRIKAQVRDLDEDPMMSALGFKVALPHDGEIPPHLYMPRDEYGDGPHILHAIFVETDDGPIQVGVTSVEALDVLLEAWVSAAERRESRGVQGRFDPPDAGDDKPR